MTPRRQPYLPGAAWTVSARRHAARRRGSVLEINRRNDYLITREDREAGTRGSWGWLLIDGDAGVGGGSERHGQHPGSWTESGGHCLVLPKVLEPKVVRQGVPVPDVSPEPL